MDFITARDLIKIFNEKRVIFIYPRKHVVCIDGSKYFKVSAATLNKYNYFLNHGIIL